MRVYIICDLEGTAGVADHRQQCWFDGALYAQARRWATLELNAAVEGALAAGATEVVAWDGHGNLPGGLDIELVHPACSLITNGGDGGPPAMERGWDAAMLVGLHAMADTPYGVLDHSFMPDIAAVWLNGVLIGEIGMNLATAAEFGIPTVMVAADKAGVSEAQALVPQIVGAAVKEGLRERGGFHTPALSLTPVAAQALIRAQAEAALRGRAAIPPWRQTAPYRQRTRYRKPELADAEARRPGVARLDDVTVEEVKRSLCD